MSENAVRHWMRDVLDRRGWSPETWARKAHVAATTITRPLNNPEHRYTPSWRTLTALANAAGVQLPSLGGAAAERVRQVPIWPVEALRNGRLKEPEGANVVATTGVLSDDVRAAVVDSATMTGRQINPGDRIVIEPPEQVPLENGDLVAVVEKDGVAVYELFDQMLFAHADQAIRPQVLSDAHVVGVVVEVNRPIRRG